MAKITDSSHSHSEDEITLRCSRCGKPITPAEAVQTPTGYRCQDCVRRQQKVFDTSQPLDYVLGFLIAAALSFLGSLVIRFVIGFIGFLTFIISPAIGVGIAEVIRFVIKKRRAKRLFQVITAGMILGGLPFIVILALNFTLLLSAGSFSLRTLLPLAYQILYLVLAVPSAYYRLSGSRR